MKLDLYQVDAFTDRPFGGNPAAVCPLEEWLPDDLLQAIAAENNLSETAYFVRKGDVFGLRWFTPAVEVDLCGHATLATAWVIFNECPDAPDLLRFTTRSGELRVSKGSDGLAMDFPVTVPVPCATPMTYVSPMTGKQYVLISVGGAPYSADKGDYLIAFALKGGKP